MLTQSSVGRTINVYMSNFFPCIESQMITTSKKFLKLTINRKNISIVHLGYRTGSFQKEPLFLQLLHIMKTVFWL